MSTNKWRGDAPSVAQVNTITPATVSIGNVFTLTINTKAVTFTATAATVANVTAGLAAAVAASTIPEFQEVTAADNTTNLTLTANTAGVPFTQTSSSATGSGSGGHSLSTSTTTASSGPNHWGIAANWSLGAIPVDGDDVYIDGDVDILYDLDQSSVDLLTLNIPATYTGKIGLPVYNSAGYIEYRTRYLTLTSDTVNIGYGDGSGSGRILLSLGSNATVLNITNTGSAIEQGIPALIIAGSASTYTLTVLKGSVGVATEVGQTATLDLVTIADGTVTLGSGCTTTAIAQSGGTLATYSAVTTFTVWGGEAHHFAGAVTTLTIDGGTVYYRSTGTVATLKVGSDGVIDFTQDTRARTVTTTTLEAGASLIDTLKTVTFTNPLALNRCSLAEIKLDLGTHISLLVSTPTPPTVFASVYSALIGDGVTTAITINQATHGLAPSNKMLVGVYLAATGVQEYPAIAVNNSTGAVTVTFGSAPASNAYRVVILGGVS